MNDGDLPKVEGPRRTKAKLNPVIDRVNSLAKRTKSLEDGAKRYGPVNVFAVENGVFVRYQIQAMRAEVIT